MADQSLDATFPGYTGPRRSLILAGGGMRVAYQAGVLKALSELGLTFAHGDGTSGGTMNLAMLLSGLTPDQMCDRWRTLEVERFGAPMPIEDYLRAWDMMGMASSDGIRNYVFPHLGIDIPAINRSTGMAGTFNVCNFSRKTSEVITGRQLTMDLLVAGISLPIFMPAVQINGDWYTDSVWIKDANLLTAVDRGAEELWIVWCIGNTPRYLPGAFNQYVHMIEMAGDGRLNIEFEQIQQLNQQAANQNPSSSAKPIKAHVIKPRYPLPLDPDFFVGRITASTLIEMGYADTYRYIETEMKPQGVPLTWEATQMIPPALGVTFSKTLEGPLTLNPGGTLTLNLTTRIMDIDTFLSGDPTVVEITGNLAHPAFGPYTPLIEAKLQPAAPANTFHLNCRFLHDGSQYLLQGTVSRATGIQALPVAFRTLPFTIDRITTPGAATPTNSERVANGTLRQGLMARLKTLRTLHATNSQSLKRSLNALWKFFRFSLR